MTKTVKGFINKGKKGSYGISTSVYNGQDAIKDVQEKVIASLEAFGFKKFIIMFKKVLFYHLNNT